MQEQVMWFSYKLWNTDASALLGIAAHIFTDSYLKKYSEPLNFLQFWQNVTKKPECIIWILCYLPTQSNK